MYEEHHLHIGARKKPLPGQEIFCKIDTFAKMFSADRKHDLENRLFLAVRRPRWCGKVSGFRLLGFSLQLQKLVFRLTGSWQW